MFDASELDEYWARNLDFSLLGGPDPKCIDFFDYISNNDIDNNKNRKLNIVAFSNGPRKYVCRVLSEIGLDSYFPPKNIFAVTDVLPHCKPDKESFELVLERIGAKAHETIMVEDSMKNIRMAKALGMRTILIMGRGRSSGRRMTQDVEVTNKVDNDAPDASDSAVDASVETVSEIGDVLNLWLN
jgi:FMN phosphatase YigB (HAD superfamily)